MDNHISATNEFYSHWDVVRTEKYAIRTYVDLTYVDEYDDNIDLEVILADGRRFGATFFTPENIRSLMEKWRATAENTCKYGLYFWCVDMVIVSKLTLEVIAETVEYLMQKGEFEQAFQKCERVVIDDEDEEPDVGSSDII